MSAGKLFSPATLAGGLTLSNHIVMSPMTRNRAIGNIPNDLMVEYYVQRATVGLIITEGTAPVPDGSGYPRIPGIWSAEQIEGWKNLTNAVHAKGGHIFLQIMHTGRIGHPDNLPQGGRMIGASAIAAAGQIYTDSQGMQDHPAPEAVKTEDIPALINGYVQAAKNAIEAGFDGVELHGANGYLIEQFMAPNSNQRTDQYGQDRNLFLLETTAAVAAAIGKEKTAVRLSPYGVYNDIQPYSEEQAIAAAAGLQQIGIAYLHLVNHSSMGAPAPTESVVKGIRAAFTSTLILSGGYDAARAEADLQSGMADLIAFGRPVLANPDFVQRIQSGAPLNPPDFSTFYTPGEKGYTDYPFYAG